MPCDKTKQGQGQAYEARQDMKQWCKDSTDSQKCIKETTGYLMSSGKVATNFLFFIYNGNLGWYMGIYLSD